MRIKLLVCILCLLVAEWPPALAHTTVGDPVPGGRINATHSGLDPDGSGMRVASATGASRHVPGPTGYVFPGSGLIGDQARAFPAFRDPNEELSLKNIFSPHAAILASTDDRPNVGDLIFGLNFTTAGLSNAEKNNIAKVFDVNSGLGDFFNPEGLKNLRYRSWTIYIPPEFKPPVDWTAGDDTNVLTTITDDPAHIYVFQASRWDPFGPGWWVIHIVTSQSVITFPLDNSTKAVQDRWFYVRVNGMTAPKAAGEYFFKMFLNATYPPAVTGKAYTPDLGAGGLSSRLKSVPPQNWPSLLVKAEIDPAVILGTIRHGGLQNTTLFGQPVKLPCKITADGVAIDPLQGKTTGRRVAAQAFINATRVGRYELQGLAAGTYRLTASCAGYPPVTLDRQVTVQRGQSLHGADFFLRPGPVIAGRIFSKLMEDPNVAAKWTSVPLLSDLEGSLCSGLTTPANPTGFDALPLGPSCDPALTPNSNPGARQFAFEERLDAPLGGFPYLGGSPPPDLSRFARSELALSRPGGASGGQKVERSELWKPISVEMYDAVGNLVSFSPRNLTDIPYYSYSWVNQTITYQLVAFPWESTLGPLFDPLGVHNGVGPAQIWWLDPSRSTFDFQFGNRPGLAFSNGFGVYGAPTAYDGHVPQTFATWTSGILPGRYSIRAWANGYVQLTNYTVLIPAFEEAGVVRREIDLFRSSVVSLDIHFHDSPGRLRTAPIGGPDPGRYVIAQAFDSENRLAGFNFTWAQANTTDISIQISGFGLAGPDIRGLIRKGKPGGLCLGLGGSFCRSTREGANLPVGTDSIFRGIWFWPTFPRAGSPLPFMRYSMLPYINQNDYGLLPGTYTLRVFVRGYVQTEFPYVTLGLGGLAANVSLSLIRGAGVNVTVNSKDWQTPPRLITWRLGDAFFGDLSAAEHNGRITNAADRVSPVLRPNTPTVAASIYTEVRRHSDNATRLIDFVARLNGLDGNWVLPSQAAGFTSQPAGGAPVTPGENPEGTSPARSIRSRLFFDPRDVTGGSRSEVARVRGSFFAFNGTWYPDLTGPDSGVYNARRPPNSPCNLPAKVCPQTVGDLSTILFGFSVPGFPSAIVVGAIDGGYAGGDENIGLSVFFPPEWFGGFLIDAKVGGYLRNMGISGGDFQVRTCTWGYVQNRENWSSFSAAATTMADVKQDVIFGAIIEPTVRFKTQDLLSPVPFDMFYHLLVKKSGRLIGEARAGGYQGGGDNSNIGVGIPGNLFLVRNTGAILAGTDSKRFFVAGFPNPVRLVPGFEVSEQCGIEEGRYEIELRVYYVTRTGPFDATSSLVSPIDTGFPPGLLLGDPWYGTLRPGFGPFAQRGSVAVAVNRGSIVTPIFELDRLGTIRGTVLGFNLQGDLRSISWAHVRARAQGSATIEFTSFDGTYELFLTPGTYTLSSSAWNGDVGFLSQSLVITVTIGGDIKGIDFELRQSNIPIPELPSLGRILPLTSVLLLLIIISKRFGMR